MNETALPGIVPGDIVQIDPEHNDLFGGCFMVVSEVKPWGVQGYVTIPKDGPRQAYYRVPRGKFEVVGHAVWTQGLEEQGDEQD